MIRVNKSSLLTASDTVIRATGVVAVMVEDGGRDFSAAVDSICTGTLELGV